MKIKFNLLKPKMNLVYGLSTALIIIVLCVASCTKDDERTNLLDQPGGNPNKIADLSFVVKSGSSDQTFIISCTCGTPSFTLTNSVAAVLYGTTTPTTIPLYNSNFSNYFFKNTYYYLTPYPYISTTKCLKVKFITGNVRPTFYYSGNTWYGLQSNSDIDATQVDRSSVPSCTPC